jgi:hypothetical protein
MREQAECMRLSSTAPFESNLQDRIINMCADFSYYADEARSSVTLWGSAKRNEPGVAQANLDLDRI